MKTNSALEKALAFAAKLAADQGVEIEKVEVEKIPTVIEYAREQEEKKENRMLAYEAVSIQLHHKHPLMTKKCRWCKEVFQTGYCYVALCSDSCRAEEFRQVYGIEMKTLNAPPAFWEYEKPLLMPPDMLANLVSWARGLVSKYDEVQASEPTARMAAIPPEVREEGLDLQGKFRQSQIQETLEQLSEPSLVSVDEALEVLEIPEPDPSSEDSQVQASPQQTLGNLQLQEFSFGD